MIILNVIINAFGIIIPVLFISTIYIFAAFQLIRLGMNFLKYAETEIRVQSLN
ncbi:MAG: hypothetical protein LBS84_01345 [Clostridiales bacterium]|jgi:hypothetical protein|nr:hypothetical protein [Clostridiales bacterium]